ncbi:MAG TPA: 4-(cytidine 5'-diphospho)-2-C-methyl-D-erythritol kinase, partial [Erythrobacter sp.]|nr:4-(cytidine 5'-diphospho)-2-C-methyl-D-erythritol kinase [Erythrobacter sp.]
GDARSVAIAARNDLEGPAISLCPQIAGVLAELGGTSPILARMSGSGATCFALYESVAARDAAASQIGKLHTGWWQMKGLLR